MEKIWLNEYPEHFNSNIDLSEYQSIGDMLDKSCIAYGDDRHIINFNVKMSFRQLHQYAREFAGYLQNVADIKPGDRVALMMPNVLQYPVAIYGVLLCGGIVVNTNPLYTARELEHQLNDSSAKALLVFETAAHIYSQIQDRVNIEIVLISRLGDLLGPVKGRLMNIALRYIKRGVQQYHLPEAIAFPKTLALGRQHTLNPVPQALDDIAFLQYTGGTTGLSKGAMLSHSNLLTNVLQGSQFCLNYLHEELHDTYVISALPLYHIFALTVNFLLMMKYGKSSVLITNPRDTRQFLNTLKQYKPAFLSGVNTLFNLMVHCHEFDQIDWSQTRVTLAGGMALQQTVANEWHQRTGHYIRQAYGLTETSPGVCIAPYPIPFDGSIGLPLPATDISIRDDNNQEVDIEAIGELCIKGPQLMQGYWQQSEANAEVMTPDGYFRSGDMARIDSKGYVYIVDRKKDMIVVSGFNVYPNEVEDIATQCPSVNEAACLGIADEQTGEAIKLFIVTKNQANISEEMIINFCKQHLTAYKVPKQVCFVKELPKNNMGKILKRELREK